MGKENLLKEFQKNPSKYWGVELFKNNGFIRAQCESCKGFFWTLDSNKKICSGPECIGYQFIGQKNTKKKWDLFESWKNFESFFKQHGHESIPRYSVISRWHPSLFFTMASIQDFQRFEGNQLSFEYPANPLIVPQISLRFNDIDNVGVSGRHMTCFQMSGQHAFNDETGGGYWKDKCIELNFKFLTKVMGIHETEVVYKEDIWSMPDYSAFGPCLESLAKGLEIVNNVFMEFQLSGSEIKELPLKVVDVGWGAERIPWYTQGTSTIYDVTFGNVIDRFKKRCEIEYDEEIFRKYAMLAGSIDIEKGTNTNAVMKDIASKLGISFEIMEKKIEPLIGMYSVLDHARTLIFAISDGSLPSNVAGGYNLRVILRRALGLIDKFKWDLKLEDVVLWHIEHLKKMFPELERHKDEIATILEVEKRKYKESKERAKRIIEGIVKKEEKVDEKKLIDLYDSHGITPELLADAGLKVEIPPNFYVKVTERHMEPEPAEERPKTDIEGLPKTKLLFYDKPDLFEFGAKVLSVSGDSVVLDQTAFYGRSGGQEPDLGRIEGCEVVDVQKVGDIIIHRLKGCGLKTGQTVNCQVDRERRLAITRHHAATHIINAAARQILGSWVWQHSAFKDVDKARLDITHFEALTDQQAERIENAANEIVEKDLPIKVEFLPRGVAEERYGFRIYQGGAIPEKTLRIVSIGDRDVEACGGTHELLKTSKEVGRILILKTKRIQDGAVRIEFAAGDVALDYLKEKERILKEVADVLNVKEKEVPATINELFENWKKKRKELKKLRKPRK